MARRWGSLLSPIRLTLVPSRFALDFPGEDAELLSSNSAKRNELTWQTTRGALARPRARGIAAAADFADDDASDVIAREEEEPPKPRALRRPVAEHAKASAHRLPVEEATGAVAALG